MKNNVDASLFYTKFDGEKLYDIFKGSLHIKLLYWLECQHGLNYPHVHDTVEILLEIDK